MGPVDSHSMFVVDANGRVAWKKLAPDTMRQIVSLRMPDALMERVEEVARGRGVSPSSLMRALIAAGLDRSYAAVTPDELAPGSAPDLAIGATRTRSSSSV